MDLVKMCVAAGVSWWLTQNTHRGKRKCIKTETQLAGSILRLGEDSDSESSDQSPLARTITKKAVIESDYIRRVAEDIRHTEVPNLLMLSATLLKLIKIQQETLNALKVKNRLMTDRVGMDPSYLHSTPSTDALSGRHRGYGRDSTSDTARSSFDEQEKSTAVYEHGRGS